MRSFLDSYQVLIFLLTGGEITSDLRVPFFVGTCIFKVGLLAAIFSAGEGGLIGGSAGNVLLIIQLTSYLLSMTKATVVVNELDPRAPADRVNHPLVSSVEIRIEGVGETV